jgi:hypothetical protein
VKQQQHGGGLHLYPTLAQARARTLKAPPGWDCPEHLDNSGYCTPLESQGNNPWCAAYSMAQLLTASYWREFHRKIDLPEGDIYAGAKRRDRITGDGTTLDAVMAAVDRHDFGLGVTPTLAKERVLDAPDVLFAVHKFGLVLVGMQISKGWDKLRPDGSIGNASGTLGGHAVLVSGYDTVNGTIWGPNWWGRTWGRDGFWFMTIEQFAAQFAYGYAIRIAWR